MAIADLGPAPGLASHALAPVSGVWELEGYDKARAKSD